MLYRENVYEVRNSQKTFAEQGNRDHTSIETKASQILSLAKMPRTTDIMQDDNVLSFYII